MSHVVPALYASLPEARRALAAARALEPGAAPHILARHVGALTECLAMVIDGLDAQRLEPTPRSEWRDDERHYLDTYAKDPDD